MKTKKKSYSVASVIVCSILALIVTISAITAYQSSVLTYETEFGGQRSLFIGDVDRGNVEFEDSTVFSEVFKDTAYDITRMCVIKNQMETAGEFDPDKKIDISSFANRRDRSYMNQNVSGAGSLSSDTSINKDGATEYRLDDLIKWGNYGFDLIPVTGTQAQLEAYFYSMINNVGMGDVATEASSVHYDTGDASYLFDEDTVVQEDNDRYTEYVLVERYKSADKKSITDRVTNRKEYRALVRELIVSSGDLFNNYNAYVEYKDRYGDGRTNVLYCYQLTDVSGHTTRYSNLDGNVNSLSNDQISKMITSHPKYVCFNPDKLQTAGNIGDMNSVFMKNLIYGYEYSFGEGSRIWMAFDENYGASDAFLTLKNEYAKTNTLFGPAVIAAILALLGYAIVFIFMTIKAGRVQITDEAGEKAYANRPAKMDKVPVEILLAVIVIVGGVIILGSSVAYDETADLLRAGSNNSMIYAIWGTIAVVSNLIMLPLYLMLVRKIKCKLMWKGSIIKWITDKIHAGVTDLYDNGHTAVRIWLPYLLFLALNLVLVLLGVGGIIVAFIIDIFVGFWLYKDATTRNKIVEGIKRISKGEVSHKVDTAGLHGDNLALAGAVNSIGDGISKAVDTSMRDEKIRGYVDILDQKSQRLKQLTDDLVEASKISSGNISLNIEKINLVELIHQSVGEFSEKFEEKGLKAMLNLPTEPVCVNCNMLCSFPMLLR